MARNRVTSQGYSFLNGSRQITITDSMFSGFTKEDIRLLINETQKVVYLFTTNKSKISVTGNVITIDSTFPPLATGDDLTIEIDLGFVGVDAVISEINAGKKVISDAITLKGVASDPTDSFSDLADQIIDITGDITVTPLTTNPSWHDLAYEVAQYVDFINPYAFAILLDPSVTSIALSGAAAYKLSDGRIITSNQTITFGPNEAGRENIQTKYVIYRRPDPYMTQNFGSYTPSLVRLILGAFNLNMDWSTISFNSVRIGFAINGSELTNPIIYQNERKLLALQASQFSTNPALNTFIFPPFPPDATDAEKVLTIPDNFLNGATSLHSIGWPLGIKTLTISGTNAFLNLTNLTSLTFPLGLNTLTISGLSCFQNATNIRSLIFPSGLQTLTISGRDSLNTLSSLTTLIFPAGLQSLNISGQNALRFLPSLTSLVFPAGIQTISINGADAFGNIGISSLIFPTGLTTLGFNSSIRDCLVLSYIFFSKPTTNFSFAGITGAIALTSIELENKWNFSINLSSATLLTAINTKTLTLDKLVDKRFDGTNPSLVDTSTTSPIVTDTNGNGNFLELFRVNDTINIAGGGNRTIASIQSRNQLTLTANAATTGTGQTYNMNKTLTLAQAVKDRLATTYGANWADTYTARGWTIA